MGRTRRAAIDSGFSESGNGWSQSSEFEYFYGPGVPIEFNLPFSILGYSTVTLWQNGVLSLGSATQAQIDFMNSGASVIPGSGNPGFPGDFFLVDYLPIEGAAGTFEDPAYQIHEYYAYGIGLADYTAPFLIEKGVKTIFFELDFGTQIILDENGFSILGYGLNGYYVGGLEVQVYGDIQFDNYPDFFVFSGTPDADDQVGTQFDDTFISSAGADHIDGLGGTDTVSYALSPAGVIASLAASTATGGDAEGDVLVGIENLKGSGFDDSLTGDGLANALYGLGGNDVISGGEGDDFIEGGAGRDTLDGGAGFDTLSYLGSASGVSVSLLTLTGAGGDAAGDKLSGFERVFGSNFNDTLQAAAAGSDLFGQRGDDVLLGSAGVDALYAGEGDDFLSGGAGADFLYGHEGSDTASYASSTAAVTIDLTAGTAAGGEAAGDLLSSIEGLVGTAYADILTGNFADNRLEGSGGADTLYGRDGDDVLIGGAGNDTLHGDPGNDTLIGGEGIDLLFGGMGADTLIGGSGADTLLSSAGSDILSGEDGNDVIDGGAGADSMSGGSGDDLFYVDNPGDVIFEDRLEGTDRILTTVSYTLASNSWVETLEAKDVTSLAPLNLTGNGAVNTLIGTAGANVLNGKAGADTMVGNGGNDTYFVDSVGDVVVEGVNGGNDLVHSGVNYTLGANVERLFLVGTANLTATGNGLNNRILGNAGANVIDGKAGADFMNGKGGDDAYYVDNTGDIVVEEIDAGTDDVVSTVSFALRPNIEQLTLVGSASRGTGNSSDNAIVGNSIGNVIDGRGGADMMEGHGGNDTYHVDNVGDQVIELAGGGDDDFVISQIDYQLPDFVERLLLGGNAAIDGTGNDLGNIILGNAAANAIIGGGGNDLINGGGGNDTLEGGIGNDIYRFSTAVGGGNVDTIVGYSVADDRIELSSTVFSGLGKGALAAGAFNTGTAATDADDRIIYDPLSGALLFDADGSGIGAAVHFATLTPGLGMSASEFFVI